MEIAGREVGLAARREDPAPADLSGAAALFHIGVFFPPLHRTVSADRLC